MTDAAVENKFPPKRRVLWVYMVVQAVVGLACAVLLGFTTIALVNAVISGEPLPPILLTWSGALHLMLVYLVLPLTLIQIIRRKGDRLHRRIGYAWAACLTGASLFSFGMHQITGGFGPAHVFSVATLVALPLIILFAMLRWRAAHRWLVILYILLNVIAAGHLAFDPGRALGQMLPDSMHYGFLPD